MASWTVIAETGERFADFRPYVASVNDAGTVAFQAVLREGGDGVFTGTGDEVTEAAGPALLAAVTSHPDVNDEGALCWYGELRDGSPGVFLLREERLTAIANTGAGLASIGPLGPTMNDDGAVAFRAGLPGGASGVFVAADTGVATVAVAGAADPWERFHGLPVVCGDGTVVFRADRRDGTQGIYAARDGRARTVVATGDTFETLGLFPSVDEGGTVAFAATLPGGGPGIFTAGEGGIVEVVGPDGAFESCRGALVYGAGDVVRIATPRGGTLGLFAGPDPERDRILACGDPLLGSTVEDFAANPVSVNVRGQVAVRVVLGDGRQLILRADRVS